MSSSILLIGAGLTNALIANNIRNCTKLNKLLDVHIWEKGSAVGGRFQTKSVYNTPTDFGAQYVSYTKGEEWSEPYFKELLDADLITKAELKIVPGYRIDEKKRNFTFNKGAQSIVEHFYKKADVENKIRLNNRVLGLSITKNGKIFVTNEETNNGGSRHRRNGWFDAIISTIPIPEFLESNIVHHESVIDYPLGIKQNLAETQFISRYALGLYFDSQIKVADDEMKFNFIRKSTNPIVYWTLNSPSSIILHTTKSFGKEYAGQNLQRVEDLLWEKAKAEIKSIQGLIPAHVEGYFWKNSQVHIPYIGSPGFIQLNKSPTVLLAGDGFSYSGLEGCIRSADATTDHLKKLFAKTDHSS